MFYIAKALELSKMSQRDLARKLNVVPSRVSKLLSIRGDDLWERVPVDLLYQIEAITGVPLSLRMHSVKQSQEEQRP